MRIEIDKAEVYKQSKRSW